MSAQWSHRAFRIQSQLYVIEYTCKVDGAPIVIVSIDSTPIGRSILTAESFKDIAQLSPIRTGLGTSIGFADGAIVYRNVPWMDIHIPADVFFAGLAGLDLYIQWEMFGGISKCSDIGSE